MRKFAGVANTLFVPLVARINVSKKIPDYFFDSKALELEPYLPEGADKGTSEFTDITSAARYYNMDKAVTRFAGKKTFCNIVYPGAGLETAYDRLHDQLPSVQWYEVDLPEVIEARKKIFGRRENETLISGDMFEMAWVKKVDTSLPTLLVVSGVFQYFHEEEVVGFIKNCARAFPDGEIVFDATGKTGLIYTNWLIRRTGNPDALMYFGINDCKAFADKCGMKLLEVKTFFPDALKMLGGRLKFTTRFSMKFAERNRQVLILHLKLNG